MSQTATPIRKNRHTTIIINPSLELRRYLQEPSEEQTFLIFSDTAVYERWREEGKHQQRTIAEEVREGLSRLSVEPRFFRRELRAVIELLSALPAVPRLRVLSAACGSERSLYRIWNPAIPETPARFLARVRVLHALRLRDQDGYSAKQAAFEAGFANPTMLRRALNPRTRTISDSAGRNRQTLAGNGA